MTEYGQNVRNAVKYYNQGLYIDSIEPWQEVLKSNANCELAYVGLGKAYYQLNDYEKAIKYFELGNDDVGRSLAFEGYRSILIAKYLWIAVLLLFLIIGFIVFKKIMKHMKKRG